MKFGIIGCGKMGQALLQGVLEAGVFQSGDVVAHDKFPAAVETVVEKFGVTAAGSNRAVAERSDAILLAVKPQDMTALLSEIAEAAASSLLISIAAGIRLETMEQTLRGSNAKPGVAFRLVRVMPNTPALVGRGASAYALGGCATGEDAALAEKILGAVGYVTRVDESLLDAVTALSGSGPAYIFAMIESMVAGAIEQGLDEKTALDLATHTVSGAAALVLATGDSPAVLRENVTSPNGTTFAALESMRANGFDRIVRGAIKAAKDRSVELGKA